MLTERRQHHQCIPVSLQKLFLSSTFAHLPPSAHSSTLDPPNAEHIQSLIRAKCINNYLHINSADSAHCVPTSPPLHIRRRFSLHLIGLSQNIRKPRHRLDRLQDDIHHLGNYCMQEQHSVRVCTEEQQNAAVKYARLGGHIDLNNWLEVRCMCFEADPGSWMFRAEECEEGDGTVFGIICIRNDDGWMWHSAVGDVQVLVGVVFMLFYFGYSSVLLH